MKQQAPPPFSFSYSRLAGLEFSIEAPASQVLQIGQALNGRIRTPRWRAHLVVGVVGLRPLRPRRAGGPSYYRPLADEACAPLCAARRLATRAVPLRPAFLIGHDTVGSMRPGEESAPFQVSECNSK